MQNNKGGLQIAEKRIPLASKDHYATIRELTTLDYMMAKRILAEAKVEDDETFQIALVAMSLKSLEMPDGKGKIDKVDFGPVATLTDIMARCQIPMRHWFLIVSASDELNGVNPETLKK